MATKLTANTRDLTYLCYEEQELKVRYRFTNASKESSASKSHKVLIELSFVHPATGEQFDLCVIKSVLLLCQPSEVIEAVIHREVKEFLGLFCSKTKKQNLVNQTNLEIA